MELTKCERIVELPGMPALRCGIMRCPISAADHRNWRKWAAEANALDDRRRKRRTDTAEVLARIDPT